MYTISKQFTFEAAHQLYGLKPGHKCLNLHGHSYTAMFIFQADTLINDQFVIDYRDLDYIKEYIDKNLDHQNLNDVLPKEMPTTAENIARYLYDELVKLYPQLVAVRVAETSKTWAQYNKLWISPQS
jgi:6-pyruvoyltetrahydropterin/6-carboxytetrahydropterin synthase